ncbi:MAG TPA: lipoyl(octanoyl) transferase LipB [Puia sp.]|nr:lipoyl(octanoyl) transferase LipB [Puia sp.]
MKKETVLFEDMGEMEYGAAWDYQESLLRENVRRKTEARLAAAVEAGTGGEPEGLSDTVHYLLFVEHPPVYTLGKSGDKRHILIDDEEIQERGAQFFHTNRGGDVTFHGPGQLVGYPILDLEKFRMDLGWYLRSLEEAGIRVLAEYGILGERSPGETGVWIEPEVPGKARKICAMGVRCSRWITMHGFAFNINTDLRWFGNIVPCGIQDKSVTSLEKELGRPVDPEEVKMRWKKQFETVFGVELQ